LLGPWASACAPKTFPILLPDDVGSFQSVIIAIESDSLEKVLRIDAVSLADPAPSLPILDAYDGSLLVVTLVAFGAPLASYGLVPGPLSVPDPGQFTRAIPTSGATIMSATVSGDRASPWRPSGLTTLLSSYRIVDPTGSDPCAGFGAKFSIEVPEEALQVKAVATVSSTLAVVGGLLPPGSSPEGALGTMAVDGMYQIGPAPAQLFQLDWFAYDPLHRVIFVADPHDRWGQLDPSGRLLRWAATPTSSALKAVVAAGSDGTAFLLLKAGLYRVTAGSTLAVPVSDAPPGLSSIAVVRRDRIAGVDDQGRIFFYDGSRWVQEVDTRAHGSPTPYMIDGDESIFVSLSSTDLWLRDAGGSWSQSDTGGQQYRTAAALGGGRYLLVGRGDVAWWSGTQYCTVMVGNSRALNVVSVDQSRTWAAIVTGIDSTHTHSELVGISLPNR
jgi:hypothetical protein